MPRHRRLFLNGLALPLGALVLVMGLWPLSLGVMDVEKPLRCERATGRCEFEPLGWTYGLGSDLPLDTLVAARLDQDVREDRVWYRAVLVTTRGDAPVKADTSPRVPARIVDQINDFLQDLDVAVLDVAVYPSRSSLAIFAGTAALGLFLIFGLRNLVVVKGFPDSGWVLLDRRRLWQLRGRRIPYKLDQITGVSFERLRTSYRVPLPRGRVWIGLQSGERIPLFGAASEYFSARRHHDALVAFFRELRRAAAQGGTRPPDDAAASADPEPPPRSTA
jgi:hypothetical protein